MNFKNWLLFKCCFAFIVSFVGFMEVKGTFKSYPTIDPKNDYMVTPKCMDIHLPPTHGDEELSLRTTLFEAGGDDTARPTVVTISCTMSSTTPYVNSSRTSKVNSLHYMSTYAPIVNGILLHTPSHDHHRFTSMSTDAWKEDHGERELNLDKREAWKRRRKRRGYFISGTTSASTGTTARDSRAGQNPRFQRSASFSGTTAKRVSSAAPPPEQPP